MPTMVTTPEECLRYVESVGFCAWRHQPKLAWLPSLEMATQWRGSAVTYQTWFWKDDLHIERRLYFGMLMSSGIPLFVSLNLLPALIAAQGDIDARTLHEKGLLASNALKVYEHIERVRTDRNPIASLAVRQPDAVHGAFAAKVSACQTRPDGPNAGNVWLSLGPVRKYFSRQLSQSGAIGRIRGARTGCVAHQPKWGRTDIGSRSAAISLAASMKER